MIPATKPYPAINHNESTKSIDSDQDMTMSDIVPMNDFNTNAGNLTANGFSEMLPMFEKLLPEHEEYDKNHPFQCKFCKSKYSCKSGVKEHIKFGLNPKY